MTNITPELIAKAKESKSAEELLAFAKENGVELTEEEAKTYFEQLCVSGPVSDDELDAVAGGFQCIIQWLRNRSVNANRNIIMVNDAPTVLNSQRCPYCGSTAVVEQSGDGFLLLDTSDNKNYITCSQCGKRSASSNSTVKTARIQNL